MTAQLLKAAQAAQSATSQWIAQTRAARNACEFVNANNLLAEISAMSDTDTVQVGTVSLTKVDLLTQLTFLATICSFAFGAAGGNADAPLTILGQPPAALADAQATIQKLGL